MTNQHPMTPSPELVRQWSLESQDEHQPSVAYSMVGLLATKAARWGADQELEACCEWLECDWNDNPDCVLEIRAARRPKPPSLKEQALAVLDDYSDLFDGAHQNIIRQALEQLNN